MHHTLLAYTSLSYPPLYLKPQLYIESTRVYIGMGRHIYLILEGKCRCKALAEGMQFRRFWRYEISIMAEARLVGNEVS